MTLQSPKKYRSREIPVASPVSELLYAKQGSSRQQEAWQTTIKFGLDHMMDHQDIPAEVVNNLRIMSATFKQQFIARTLLVSVEQGLALGDSAVSERFNDLCSSLFLRDQANG